MAQYLNLIFRFDYFLCIDHNVVVEVEERSKHITEFGGDKPCEFVGQFFKVKAPARKLSNDVSKKLVDSIKQKENEAAWEKKHDKKIKQRKREQDNYSRQIPIGDGILNLDGVDDL